MKTIIIFIGIFLIAVLLACTKTKYLEKYVSMDCKAGDITLTLNNDSSFNLTILYWDDKTQRHVGQESINGHWIKNKSILVLSNKNNKITYEQKTINMKIGKSEINTMAYGFKENIKEFFGTNYDLLEKEKTDNFLINATKNK